MKHQRQQYFKLGLTTLFILSGTIVNQSAFAQLKPDHTLGSENSVVNKVNEFKDIINGGAARGANLFHSFEKFNVGENRSVYFANPTGIENILTRVTGGNVSNILGILGVEGTASLFLINPNGIFFGNGATLDIRGSFTATTADEIKLGENGLFSATAPATSNLLNIQPNALFRNALRNQQATINNQGNLIVNKGKNINLFGANVINTGGLKATGGEIQLTGAENLKVRGDIETGTLLLDTKNLIIAEDNNATINETTLEGLSGNTNLIFQAKNDITINSLNDNSLSLADGSGKVTFTADANADGVGNFQMETTDTIKTNGRNLEIKGVNLTVGNIDTISERGGGNISLTSNSNITSQNLYSYSSSESGTAGNGGAISLTATNGNISTQDLYSYSSSPEGKAGNGGAISIITTNGDITTQSLYSYSYSKSGTVENGGAISLTATDGDITTKSLYSYSYSESATAQNGGAISLTATDGNISTQELYSYSSSPQGTAQNGGAISLTATDGNISIQDLYSYSSSESRTAGNAGKIILTTTGGDIFTQDLYSYSSSESATAGNGGAISLTATDGNISIQDLYSYSYSESDTAGNGGAISLTATDGNISIQNLYSYSSSSQGTAQNGGAISLTTTDGNISIQELYSYSSSPQGIAGNGGAISLTATDGDITTKSLYSYSYSESGIAGNGGAISIITTDGDITIQSLDSSSYSPEGKAGNGGAISIITTDGDITTQSLLDSSSYSNSDTAGNGGSISLFAGGDISLTYLGSYSYSNSDSNSDAAGNGGAISLFAGGDISTEYLDSFSLSDSGTGGNGGGISLFAGGDIKAIRDEHSVFSSFSVSKTGNSGNGGNITLKAKNQITDLEILTLSTSSKSGDVQIKGFSDLSVTNTDIITNKQLTIRNPFTGEDITLDVSEVGQSGNVNITSTGNITFKDSRIESDTRSSNPAGNVTFTSPGTVTFNNSQIASNTSSIGNAGNIQINAQKLILTKASEISASTTADGQAGDITLNTSTLTVAKGAKIFATTTGTGDGGIITINADKAVNLGIGVQDSSPILSVETSGAGKAGDIIVNTPSLTVSDTARITATATATATNQDGGGSITLNASKMNLAGTVGVFAETQGQAPAGTLKLNPYQNQPDLDITMFPGSIISASTTASGKGGDLIITAPENINIAGQGKLAVESKGTGDAGNIEITSRNLTLSDGVKISASTSGSGKGGNIIVKVKNNITLDGTDTGLFASTEPGSKGDSGSIDVDPETLIIKNGAGIGVNSQGTGKGGDVFVQAGTLTLDNKGFISAETANSQGGNINLNIQDLLLFRNHSQITATAGTNGAGGNGGNININAPFIIAFSSENSDITANAFQGDGGKINITTNAIFGLEYQPQLTNRSDITASSDFGLAGQVEINTPDVDPTSGLIELPGNLVNAESLLGKDICSAEQRAKNNSFTIIGKGGLPAESDELISNSPGMVEWVTRSDEKETSSVDIRKLAANLTPQPPSLRRKKGENLKPLSLQERGLERGFSNPVIEEAQGWIITADGKITLTAETPKVTLQNSGLNHPSCH